jgi:Domain of unknown function (DUF4424)
MTTGVILCRVRYRRLLLILSLFILAASSANTDDTVATLGIGGLVPPKSTKIVMESEDLEISAHKITVRYIFHNTSSKNIDALLEFPLPDLEGIRVVVSPVGLPYEKRLNFVDFKVSCNGKPVPARMEARGFFKNRDVTALLHAAGLSVSVQYDTVLPAIRKLVPAARKQLEKEGLIEQIDTNVWAAGWTERVNFYWRQHFPVRSNVNLVQTYRPSVGGGYFEKGIDDGSVPVKDYCTGADTLRRISQLQQTIHPDASGITINEREIDFILTTGNNWSGPIRHFRLLVESDSPQDIILTCMPGLKRAGPTRYELSRTNFHPSSDLKLLILQPNKQASAS